MIVYQTDHKGVFVGTAEADESPLQDGVFLIPGGCVVDPPPSFEEGQRARRVSGAWIVEATPEPDPEPEAPEPEPTTPSELIAYAANRRWRTEVGGVRIAGVPIATDDRSKIMIMGARIAAAANAAWSTIWHGADGGTYPIDAATMIAISDAVEEHVNATFAIFATVKAAIEAATITSREQIDAAFVRALT